MTYLPPASDVAAGANERVKEFDPWCVLEVAKREAELDFLGDHDVQMDEEVAEGLVEGH